MAERRGKQNMETAGFTARIPIDLLHTLRFIAAHKEVSINTLIVEALRLLVATTHVELPSDLLLAEKGLEKES
jgi:predicted HicB family RNase H-like nuclease